MRNAIDGTSRVLATLLLALCAGCPTTEKFVHSTAPKKDENGSRVHLKSGFGQEGTIEEVGSYTSVPPGYTGPVPPGWTTQEAVLIAQAEARKAEAEARKAEAETARMEAAAQKAGWEAEAIKRRSEE